jgi:cytochrome c55X
MSGIAKARSPRTCGAVVAVVGISLGFLPPVQGQAGSASGGAIETQRARELVRLVRQDCGSCHGMTLQGGLGPALTPASLRNKPAESLKLTILQGRPGTAMPGWSRFLSEADAEWIVAQLVSGFPRE